MWGERPILQVWCFLPGYFPPRLLLMKQTMRRMRMIRAMPHIRPMNQPLVAMSTWSMYAAHTHTRNHAHIHKHTQIHKRTEQEKKEEEEMSKASLTPSYNPVQNYLNEIKVLEDLQRISRNCNTSEPQCLCSFCTGKIPEAQSSSS